MNSTSGGRGSVMTTPSQLSFVLIQLYCKVYRNISPVSGVELFTSLLIVSVLDMELDSLGRSASENSNSMAAAKMVVDSLAFNAKLLNSYEMNFFINFTFLIKPTEALFLVFYN